MHVDSGKAKVGNVNAKARPNDVNSVRNSLIGPRCESNIDIFGRRCKCLLDTGSQVSTVSDTYFSKYLQRHAELKDIGDLISIEVAGGHKLPYQGYVEVSVRLPRFVIGSRREIQVLLLVVEETPFNKEVPVLLGTNVLRHFYELCKENLSGTYGFDNWKKYRAPKPWKMTFKCLNLQLSVNNNVNQKSWKVVCKNAVTISADSNNFVSCLIDSNDLSFPLQNQSSMLVSSDGVTLPGGLILTPTVLSETDQQLMLQVVNLSQVDVTIPDNSVIGKMEEADVVPAVRREASLPSANPRVADLFKLQHLSDSQREQVAHMLECNRDAISMHDFDLGHAKGHRHEIHLTEGAQPFRQPYRRIPPAMWDEVRQHLQEMLDAGVIEHSSSPFASPIVLVRKKDQSLRFCVDYRKLNSLSIRNAQSVPRPQDIFDRLNGAKWFSSLDLKSGYWQVEVEPADKPKTAFTAGPLGFYQFVRMPFGLCNAGASFQRMIEACMGSDNLSNCLLYLDDIVVFGHSFEDHLRKLDSVMRKLKECGLKLNAKKCELFKDRIKYLGHWVTREGIATDDDKIEAVKNWPIPTTHEEVKRFLGFASFDRRFIPQFAHRSEPLQELLRSPKPDKSQKASKEKRKLPPFKWTETQQESFESLVTALTEAPVLAYADFSKPFELHTDAATSSGLGAVLYQKDQDGVLRVIAYASRCLTQSERRYPAHKLEFLAMKWAITEKFADYLIGATFIVKTDNNPLP